MQYSESQDLVCVCVCAKHTKCLPTLEVGWEGVAREGMGLTSALKYSIEVLSLPPKLLFVSELRKIGGKMKYSKNKYPRSFPRVTEGFPRKAGSRESHTTCQCNVNASLGMS